MHLKQQLLANGACQQVSYHRTPFLTRSQIQKRSARVIRQADMPGCDGLEDPECVWLSWHMHPGDRRARGTRDHMVDIAKAVKSLPATAGMRIPPPAN
jgi:hypothetical protein